jgi:hypothetical protein
VGQESKPIWALLIHIVINTNNIAMTAQQFFSTYSIDQIRSAFIVYISNQRMCDKYSVGYFLHMIDHYKYMSCSQYPEDFKRAELVAKLKEEVQLEKNLRICIQSDYMTKQILELVEDALVVDSLR